MNYSLTTYKVLYYSICTSQNFFTLFGNSVCFSECLYAVLSHRLMLYLFAVPNNIYYRILLLNVGIMDMPVVCLHIELEFESDQRSLMNICTLHQIDGQKHTEKSHWPLLCTIRIPCANLKRPE